MRNLHARSGARFAVAVALVATAALPMAARAQRISLAERVARLEQQAEANQGNIELVNQIQALQSQVQQLQGQVEELRHQLDQAQERNKQQYIDLDSRLSRLEGRPGSAAPGAANNGQLEDIQLGAPAGGSGADGASSPNESSAHADAGAEPTRVPPHAEPPAPRIDPAAEKAAYDDAINALKDGRYAESARRFEAFIDKYPKSELIPNAHYWLGESYYVTQNYRLAIESFQVLLKQYPDSQKAPDALLKLGYCQYEMKQWDAAEATLTQVVKKYPDTSVARLAQGRLRALKLEGKH